MYRGPDRRQLRMDSYNYNLPGCYFVTICTKNSKEYFGKVKDNRVVLSDVGFIAERCWLEIPNHIKNVKLDKHVIMPNHIHGIIKVVGFVGDADLRPLHGNFLKDRTKMLIPKVLHGFKSSVTRKIHRLKKRVKFSWQRSYYEHLIRSDEALDSVRDYIIQNPSNWNKDLENTKCKNEISQKDYSKRRHYANLFKWS